MFKPGDEVISKWNGMRAVVRYIDTKELMTVQYRTRLFTRGNLEGHCDQALIKAFELYEA